MFKNNPEKYSHWYSHVQLLSPSCTVIGSHYSSVIKDAMDIQIHPQPC